MMSISNVLLGTIAQRTSALFATGSLALVVALVGRLFLLQRRFFKALI